MNRVPVKIRQASVAFYAIEPMPVSDGQRTFLSGAFPRDDVFDVIRNCDPAADDYRLREDLFGGETLCLLHEDGPEPVLGAYYRDNLGRLLTEYKGEVVEAMLRDGEAPVDAAYVAFFPNDTVGMLRTSSKSPGFAKVGHWLTAIGGVACGFVSLPDPDTLAQLQQQSTGLRRLTVRAKRQNIDIIGEHSPGIAKVLRAAADASHSSAEVLLELRSNHQQGTHFTRDTLAEVRELVSALPALEAITVHVKGQSRPVNLKRSHVVGQITVPLIDTTRIGLKEAAQALFDAYKQEQVAVQNAVKALRGSGR